MCDVTEIESDRQQACELHSEQLSSQPCPMLLVDPVTSLFMLLISVCFSEPRLYLISQTLNSVLIPDAVSTLTLPSILFLKMTLLYCWLLIYLIINLSKFHGEKNLIKQDCIGGKMASLGCHQLLPSATAAPSSMVSLSCLVLLCF